MRVITTINDLDLLEQLYPYCLRCEHTGDALDKEKIKGQLGDNVSIESLKKYLVCKVCYKKDEIILRVVSNELMSELGQRSL